MAAALGARNTGSDGDRRARFFRRSATPPRSTAPNVSLPRSPRLACGAVTSISVQLPSTPEFVIIYYAVARLGGVLSTLHTPYGAGEAEPILRHARARAVFCGAATEKADPPGMFAALAQRLPSLQHIISVGPPRDSVLSLDALIASADRAALPPLPVATDAALMCYTSGTSTAPKAVPHSFQSMLANPRQCLPVFDLKPGDRVLSAAPLTHAFGLFVVNAALMAGADVHSIAAVYAAGACIGTGTRAPHARLCRAGARCRPVAGGIV